MKNGSIRTAAASAVFCVMAVTAGAQDLNWYRGNTHVHAHKTPAAYPPDVPAKWYGTHGFDFIVQTEHEWVVDPSAIDTPKGFLVIQGQEITQAVSDEAHADGARHTHVNGLGIKTAIMPASRDVPNASKLPVVEFWRQTSAKMSVTEAYQRNFRLVREQGGIPQVNHPNAHWSVTLADLMPLDGPYLFEIANAYPRGMHNMGGTTADGKVGLSTEALWDALLSAGKIVWGVASDDSHDYTNFDNRDAPTPGKAWVVVRAPALTAAAILDGLRTGNFYASNGVYLKDIRVSGKVLSIQADWRPDDVGLGAHSARFRVTFIGREGRVLKEGHGTSVDYTIKGDEGYVRAVVTDSDGRKAWTQPVFVAARP